MTAHLISNEIKSDIFTIEHIIQINISLFQMALHCYNEAHHGEISVCNKKRKKKCFCMTL